MIFRLEFLEELSTFSWSRGSWLRDRLLLQYVRYLYVIESVPGGVEEAGVERDVEGGVPQ